MGRAKSANSCGDQRKPFGEMTVFLPSSSEAKIRLRTVDAKNGLKLLTEAQALSEVDSPDLGDSTQQGGTSERDWSTSYGFL